MSVGIQQPADYPDVAFNELGFGSTDPDAVPAVNTQVGHDFSQPVFHFNGLARASADTGITAAASLFLSMDYAAHRLLRSGSINLPIFVVKILYYISK